MDLKSLLYSSCNSILFLIENFYTLVSVVDVLETWDVAEAVAFEYSASNRFKRNLINTNDPIPTTRHKRMQNTTARIAMVSLTEIK